MAGARVIGTVGSSGKAAKALALGASYIVDRRKEDFVEAVMRLTDGKGVNLAIDSLGAGTLDRTFDATRVLGHVINIGEAEGMPFPNIRERLLPKSLTFTRFHAGHIGFGSDLWKRGVDYVVEAITSGKLEVPIVQRYPLKDVHKMHAALEGRGVSGKLLLSVAGTLKA
jgi:NADPH:quinone reductase